MKPETSTPIEAELVPQSPPSSAVAKREPSALDMIQSVIERGVTSENVAALRELVALKRDMDADQAKREFTKDFIALQADTPRIKATKVIPDRNGKMRSSFAPFEEIDSQAKPLCHQHGFTYTFSEGAFQQGKITKICTLMHKGGHERSNPYSVRIGQGPPGCSESQADGSAHSYAKRGALCDCLNIVVVGIDSDAALEGNLDEKVSAEQAFELERRVNETNSNHGAFLRFAGAASFKEIPATKYPELDQMLRRKEAQGK